MKLKHTFSRLSIGHYAVAVSLLVHVGFIAFFSSWQWELKVPEKKSPSLIKVIFIKPPPEPEVSLPPKPSAESQFAPAQAQRLHHVTPVHLKARVSEISQPVSQPAVAISQNVRVTRIMRQRPAPQMKSTFQRAMTPATARSVKVTTVRHATSGTIGVRAAPALITHFASSTTAQLPANRQTDITRAPLPPRTVAVEKSISPDGGFVARTAYSLSYSKSVSGRIQARPAPDETYFSATHPTESPSSSVPATPAMAVATLARAIAPASSNSGDNDKLDVSGLRGLFTGKVRQRIANARVYPRIARRRGLEGQPVIAFTLNQSGQLMELRLDRTSGYQLLDRAALEAVKHAAPYPEIPAPLKLNSFQFKLPISFILK